MKIVGRKIVADAEVIDMRTGADGTEYATAGEAMRAQDEYLREHVPIITVSGDTLIIETGFTDGNEVSY